ncbi:MAG: SIMPL domain-containing protein [Candidatus Pacebacteria bacterium]|jgi:hypothetical protein|nr:SIMPL domain-containing protein [Candidatus Paceibacterota bacterium]
MEKILESSALARILTAALALVLTVYVAALAVNAIKSSKFAGRPAGGANTITVSGDGNVSVKPDLAVMDFSVVSEATTVAAALDDNNKKMKAIVDVVKSLGVEEKDLQTSGYNINPRYDYLKAAVPPVASNSTPAVDVPVYYPEGRRALAGYDITQTLTVKMREEAFGKIGQIIQEVTAAGANQVGDLQFTLDNPDAAQADARGKAIDNAKNKAQTLAKQLGVKLVRLSNYSDGGYSPVYRLNYAAKDAAAGAAESAPAPSIQTGENKITVNVSLTYEIE